MSSIREQIRLKQLYADFEALQNEVYSLKTRVLIQELALQARIAEKIDPPQTVSASNVIFAPKRRGRPPKVRDGL